MTAASYTLRVSAPPARSGFRWTLALLGVCLPVPICAMSGLSLPLPATVERIAASLVPWADGVAMSANEALRTGARGSIVADRDEGSDNGGARVPGVVKIVGTRTEGERTSVILLPGADAPSVPGTTPAVPDAQPPTAPDQRAGDAQPGGAGPTPSAPATETPAPAPGSTPTTPTTPTTPAEPTQPTQPPARSDPDPVAAVKPVVDEVLAPVLPVVEETTKTVVEKVAPVVPPLPLPPLLPGLGK